MIDDRELGRMSARMDDLERMSARMDSNWTDGSQTSLGWGFVIFLVAEAALLIAILK